MPDASGLRSSCSSSTSSPDSDEKELLAERALQRVFGAVPPKTRASSPFAPSDVPSSSVGNSGGDVASVLGGSSMPRNTSTSASTCPRAKVHDLVASGETETGKRTEMESGFSAPTFGERVEEVQNVSRPGCARPKNRRSARRRAARSTGEDFDMGSVVAGESVGREGSIMQNATLSNMSQGSGSIGIGGRSRSDGGEGPRGGVASGARAGDVRPREEQQPPYHYVGAGGVARWGRPEMVRSI